MEYFHVLKKYVRLVEEQRKLIAWFSKAHAREAWASLRREGPLPAVSEGQKAADEERIVREGSVGGRAGYQPNTPARALPPRQIRANPNNLHDPFAAPAARKSAPVIAKASKLAAVAVARRAASMETSSIATLYGLTESERKTRLSEKLLSAVLLVEPTRAERVTKTIMQMDVESIIGLLDDPTELRRVITEALGVLDEQQSSESSGLVAAAATLRGVAWGATLTPTVVRAIRHAVMMAKERGNVESAQAALYAVVSERQDLSAQIMAIMGACQADTVTQSATPCAQPLTDEDVRSLGLRAHITDTVLDMHLLDIDSETTTGVVCAGTALTDVAVEGSRVGQALAQGLHNIQRLHDALKILVPVCTGDHWVAVLVDKVAATATIKNSLGAYGDDIVRMKLAHVLRELRVPEARVINDRTCEQQLPQSNDCAVFVTRRAAEACGVEFGGYTRDSMRRTVERIASTCAIRELLEAEDPAVAMAGADKAVAYEAVTDKAAADKAAAVKAAADKAVADKAAADKAATDKATADKAVADKAAAVKATADKAAADKAAADKAAADKAAADKAAANKAAALDAVSAASKKKSDDVAEVVVSAGTTSPDSAPPPKSPVVPTPRKATYLESICSTDGNVYERGDDQKGRVPIPRYVCTACGTPSLTEANMNQHRDGDPHKKTMARRGILGSLEALPQPTRSGGPPKSGGPLLALPQAEAVAIRLKPCIPVDSIRDMFVGWAVGTIFVMTWAPHAVGNGDVFISRGTIVKNNRVTYDGGLTGDQPLPHNKGASIVVWAIVPEREVMKPAGRHSRTSAEDYRARTAGVVDLAEDNDELEIAVGEISDSVLIHATREALCGYQRASREERVRHGCRFLSLPKNLMRVKGAYKGAKDDGRAPGGGASVDEHDRAIKKALKMSRAGHLGRAARILDTIVRPIAATPSVVAAKLRDLHPHSDEGGPWADPARPLENGSTLTGSLPEKELGEVVESLATGAAGGCTGWTAEMIVVIMSDDVCRREFAAFILDVMNGTIDESVRKRLVRARLVPIGKANGGIRPIAIGEVVLKIAGKVLFARYASEINAHFGRLQFGCLHKKGVERVVHNVRADLAQGRHVLAVDQANAFNTPHRFRIAMALYAVPVFRYFWRVFFLEYGAASDLLFFDGGKLFERIPSQRGTRQGSSLGGFYFCVVLQPVLEALAAEFPEINFYAYMDDVTMTGFDPEELATAFFRFRDLCRPLGLEFNAEKCDWLGAEGEAMHASLSEAGVVRCEGCVKILGAYIGEAAAIRKKLLDKLEKHDLLFERLIRMDAGSAQYGILLSCGLPRHGYNLRVHHPDVVRESALAFDRRLLDVAIVWFDIDVNDDLRILRLPRGYEGAGLVETVDICAHAYDDSVWDALDFLGRHPVPTAQKPPSQHNACARMYEERRSHLHRDGGPTVRRLLDLNGLKGAARCLTSGKTWMPPHCFAHIFRMKAHLKSTRLPLYACCPACPQLGLMMQKDFAIHVHGCTKIPSADNATGAHNLLRDKIVKTGKDNAIPCSSEPKGYQAYTCSSCGTHIEGQNVDQRVRAHDRACTSKLYRSGVDVDGYMVPKCNLHHESRSTMAKARFLLDVTIAHLLCASYLSTPIDSVVKSKILEKTTRYVTSGMIVADEFRVGVVFSTGGCDAGMMSFLSQFAISADIDFEDFLGEVTATVMWAQGASIEAAFKMAAQSRAIET